MMRDTDQPREALSPADMQVLAPFPLAAWPARDPVASLDGEDALLPDRCLALLDELGPRLLSDRRAITASLLAKRWAFVATAAPLAAMSVLDRGLDLRLGNCVMETTHDGVWRSRLVLRQLAASHAPQTGRVAWREALVTDLFAGHLTKLWGVFAQVSGIAPRILWENTAVRVYSLYEKRLLHSHVPPAVRRRIAEDFAYLVADASPDVFGLDHNPLARYFHAPTPVPGAAPQRFRKTCCLYYAASEPVAYCDGCPLLRPGGRRRGAGPARP
ncbi:Uncharacterized Fe-S protein in siderophore biosynthesis operon [plant metagenome]|uniref:Uncharacterized Fe-S protein in siderophore biosynthesis operon n=1 Tax=plant metagenome TaxID=1297885 RepID=A0A484PY92_9ZZZZ